MCLNRWPQKLIHYWWHTFMCTCSINSGSSLSWQRKLMVSFMVPTNKAGGLVWFCQLKTNPVTLSLFSHRHGTGPRSTSLLLTGPVMFPCRSAKKELPSVLSTRSNVFDDDEFDVFHRDRVDMSRVWKGRRWVLWSQVRNQYQLFPLK